MCKIRHALIAASKHAVVGLTKFVAVEYGSQGVRVNAVAPASIDSPMLQELSAESREENWCNFKRLSAWAPLLKRRKQRFGWYRLALPLSQVHPFPLTPVPPPPNCT